MLVSLKGSLRLPNISTYSAASTQITALLLNQLLPQIFWIWIMILYIKDILNINHIDSSLSHINPRQFLVCNSISYMKSESWIEILIRTQNITCVHQYNYTLERLQMFYLPHFRNLSCYTNVSCSQRSWETNGIYCSRVWLCNFLLCTVQPVS